jgi:hypothetical protein
MTAVGVANIFLLVCVVWVVWERRLTFGSRFDSPITIGTVLFGAGVGLTSPWPVVAGFPFPFTGKYFALIVIGQFCLLAATVFGIKAVYLRLLADEALNRFFRRRIAPLTAVASVALMICFVASSLTLPRPVDRPAFGALDRWLAASWLVLNELDCSVQWLDENPASIRPGTDLATTDFPVLVADRHETLNRFMPWADALRA